MSASSPRSRSPRPENIGGRYRVLAQIGRGGSAYVYEVEEIASGRVVALKRLRHDLPPSRAGELGKHVEREFYALSQLRHPRVIEVYDYGVSDGLPHYTMELLQGSDLRALAPLPWRRVCELIYDVASSLALLHSRRFVHRDVTPANIRTTRGGSAKLIDFGAMTVMGQSTQSFGTPAYVAPEVQACGVLDASTDVFSLGATLYFTLTGRAPFAAVELAKMPSAWEVPPQPLSVFVPDIPAGLEALVLAMLDLEPAHRPSNAFEVMQRLAAIAGLPMSESASVSQGYLSAPQVFGRDGALRNVRTRLQRVLTGNGGATWIEGEPGAGRSRLLELCSLEAKALGATVLRLDATKGGTAFEGARRLGQNLIASLPEPARAALPPSPELNALLEHGDAGTAESFPALHGALVRWLLASSTAHPIVVAVDDVHRLDEPTSAWLAALAHVASGAKLLLLSTAESAPAGSPQLAAAVIRQRSEVILLQPLTRAESDAMFGSIFGAAPNLALLCERIFAAAAGNPRRSLALAQHLLDTGHVVYAAGAWSLPDTLPAEALGADFGALFQARLARLGKLARTLAETQALSLAAALRRDDYQVLVSDATARSLDDALTELVAHDVVRSDGTFYVLSERGYAPVLEAQLPKDALADGHRALARLARQQQRHAYVIAYHELNAGNEAQALQLLVRAADTMLADLSELDHRSVQGMLERAYAASIALARPKREQFELLRQLVTLSVLLDNELYWRYAPVFRAQLEADSGLRAYWAHAAIEDANERLRTALTEAQTRYADATADERVYRVDEALRFLAFYVASSIAIGARALDVKLLRGLPGLLEPFVGLSPLLAAIWENVEATCDAVYRARPERALARWQRVHEQLEAIATDPRTPTIRAAVAYGLGELTATLGLASQARQWVEQLDRNPLQRVNAMRVRRIVCLQHGDWAGAERARERAELMALQSRGRQLFEAPLWAELHAHWFSRDLAGVKHTGERIARLAAVHPGWRASQLLAGGYFEALRGDATRALHAFDACIAISAPDSSDPDRIWFAWLAASTGALAMLIELGRNAEARARGESVLAQCVELEIDISRRPVECQLALAEASDGETRTAAERVDRAIADQQRRGVSGLQLGTSYEARARVALYERNAVDAAKYAALSVREYGHAPGAAIAARYARLLQDARRLGVPMPTQSPPGSLRAPAEREPWVAELARAFDDAPGPDRAQTALGLLCERGEADGGHLYVARRSTAELELIASSIPPPSAAMKRFATGFWQQQLEDAEMSAVLTELPWNQDTYRPASFLDLDGSSFDVVLLYSAGAEPSPHVGVAFLLRAGEPPGRSAWSTAWLSALARQIRERCSADATSASRG